MMFDPTPEQVEAAEVGREAQLERAARELNRFGWTCHGGTHEPGDYDSCDDCQTVCVEVARAAFHEMSGTPHLSAGQVWAIAKAEHDYANDSDNVPAFVSSLVDALQTAGIPFDEVPFSEQGYIAPTQAQKGEAIEELNRAFGSKTGGVPSFTAESEGDDYLFGKPPTAVEPADMSIMNGWLVESVDEHTCGTGPDGHYGAHEPGCGTVPVLHLAELDGYPAELDEAKLEELLLDHMLDRDQTPRPAGDDGRGYLCECGVEILEPHAGAGIGHWHRKHLAGELAELLRGGAQ